MIEQRALGDSGLSVSSIGISSSFGADQSVYEEAFDRGCTYFTWGTFIKGRSAPFGMFMRNMVSAGNREKITVGLLSYSHSAILGDLFLQSALKKLQCEYVDGLLLGYFSRRPPQRLLDWAWNLKDKGLVRAVGVTTHNRDMVAPLAAEGVLDYFHVRYNAVHRGAEIDIFPKIVGTGAGIVTFTATCWGKLLSGKKMPAGVAPPSAADCYRFVLANEAVDCCMMGVKNRTMLQQNLDEIEQKGAMSDNEMAMMEAIGDHLYS